MFKVVFKYCLVVEIRGIKMVTAPFILQGSKMLTRKVAESYLPLVGASLVAEGIWR